MRDGAIISTQPVPPAVPTAAPGSLALLVAAGPAAGASCTIPAGGLTVGRSARWPWPTMRCPGGISASARSATG